MATMQIKHHFFNPEKMMITLPSSATWTPIRWDSRPKFPFTILHVGFRKMLAPFPHTSAGASWAACEFGFGSITLLETLYMWNEVCFVGLAREFIFLGEVWVMWRVWLRSGIEFWLFLCVFRGGWIVVWVDAVCSTSDVGSYGWTFRLVFICE